MKTNGKDTGATKFEKIGLILTVSALLGGVYGNVNDRLNAGAASDARIDAKCEATSSKIEEQSQKIDVIYENTIEIKSDVKLLKATKADKKLLD
jgi:hypothetical protein